jgi:xylulokinase
MVTSGVLTQWFKDNFAQSEQVISKMDKRDIYNLFSDMAAEITPGSEGLIVLPYFSGERTPINDERARGVILGLTLSHTKKHIYRALLEGTANGVAYHLYILDKMDIKPKRIIAAGGGVENHIWTQIVSDVTGLKQICIGEKGLSAPLGDAYMAGFGSGIFKDFSVLKEKWVKTLRVVEPDYKAHGKYREYFNIYKDLYEHTKEDMHRLADSSTE